MQIAVLEQHACGAATFEQPKYPLGQLPDTVIAVDTAACRMRRSGWSSCEIDVASVARGVEKGHVDAWVGEGFVVIVLARMVVRVRRREMVKGLVRCIELELWAFVMGVFVDGVFPPFVCALTLFVVGGFWNCLGRWCRMVVVYQIGDSIQASRSSVSMDFDDLIDCTELENVF